MSCQRALSTLSPPGNENPASPTRRPSSPKTIPRENGSATGQHKLQTFIFWGNMLGQGAQQWHCVDPGVPCLAPPPPPPWHPARWLPPPPPPRPAGPRRRAPPSPPPLHQRGPPPLHQSGDAPTPPLADPPRLPAKPRLADCPLRLSMAGPSTPPLGGRAAHIFWVPLWLPRSLGRVSRIPYSGFLPPNPPPPPPPGDGSHRDRLSSPPLWCSFSRTGLWTKKSNQAHSPVARGPT